MDLNIRNFPPALFRELKLLAAAEGGSLRSIVIGIIETDLMTNHCTPELSAYLDKAYPDERVELMAKLRESQEAILKGKQPQSFTVTPSQRQYLAEEDQELKYERDEYSQA